MKMHILLTAAAAVAFASSPAAAQSNSQERGYNRDGYSQSQNSRAYDDRRDSFPGANRPDRRGDQRRTAYDGYYRQGAYEQNCRRGNAAVGTIFGAMAGGVLGSAASGGDSGVVVGGAVLGGLLGNTIARDIDCDAQPHAFGAYSSGLNGNIGRRYEWRHGQSRGYFMPTREFRRNGLVCRDFTETSWRGARAVTRSGTSCQARDGHWRFD